jgi:hypothetical protein
MLLGPILQPHLLATQISSELHGTRLKAAHWGAIRFESYVALLFSQLYLRADARAQTGPHHGQLHFGWFG